MELSVVIPNFNGAERLKECIPALLKAIQHSKISAEIIIVDDGSTDPGVSLIRNSYSSIKLIEHKLNKGFIPSVNDGVYACSYEIVVLLNNDVIVREDVFDTLEQDFASSNVFGISFMSLNNEGHFREGLKKAPFRLGFYKIKHGMQDQPDNLSMVHETFYAVGGHCAIRRSVFLEIGGLDPLFAPFYWEDLDLSFRAKKMGYKILYDPRCIVVHNEIGTIKTHYASNYIKRIKERNRLLFHWKNLKNKPFYLIQHVFFVLLRLTTGIFLLDIDFYAGFYLALRARLQHSVHFGKP